MATNETIIPALPAGFTLDSTPPLPSGFVLDDGPPQPTSGARQAFGRFVQSAAGVAAGLPEAIAITADKIGQAFPMIDEGKSLEELDTYRLAKGIRETAARLAPIDPSRPKSFWTDTLPGGAGSMAGFVAGGAAGRVAKLPALATTAVMGAATSGADAYDTAKQSGATDDQAWTSFLVNAGAGTSEAIPIARWLGGLDRASGGVVRRAIKEGSEEALQEVFQQVTANVDASKISGYDPDRPWLQGTGEGGAAGLTLGSLASLLFPGRPRGQREQVAATAEQGTQGPVDSTPPPPAGFVVDQPVSDANTVATQPSPSETINAPAALNTQAAADLPSAAPAVAAQPQATPGTPEQETVRIADELSSLVDALRKNQIAKDENQATQATEAPVSRDSDNSGGAGRAEGGQGVVGVPKIHGAGTAQVVAQEGRGELKAPEPEKPHARMTPAETVELNELRESLKKRGKLGKLNSKRLAQLEAKEAVRFETITPANDTIVGKNDAGETLYERADGSRYRMRHDRPNTRPQGYPDFGGDLAIKGEATLEDDFTRYQSLVKSIKGKTLDEARPIQLEIEAIKNRHGGMPPKPLSAAPEKAVAQSATIPESTSPPAAEQKTGEVAGAPLGRVTPGGAAANSEEFVGGTGLQHAVTEMERVGLNLGGAPPKVKQKMADAWDRSANALRDDPDAGRKIVRTLQDDPRTALVDDDSAVLLRYRTRLLNEINDAAEASHRGDKDALKRRGELISELQELTDATDVRGSHAGRELRWRQAISDEDYTFTSQLQRLRSDLRAGGGDITPGLQAELEARIRDLEVKLKAAQEAAATEKSTATTKAGDEAHKSAKAAAKSGKASGDDISKAKARTKAAVEDNTLDDDLGSIMRQLFRGHVAADLAADRDVIASRVLSDLSDLGVDVSRDEFDTAISGFGKYTELSKEATKVRERELRREYLLTKQIRELEAKRPLLKTGKEIAAWTDEHRRLLKQKNEAKRRHGVVVTDPARQLKSAQDARKTALRNQIADLQWQIDNRTKIVKNKTKAASDSEIDQLTADRDALLDRFNEAFPKDPEAELMRKAANLEKQIAEKEKLLLEGVPPTAAKPVNRPADPRLEPLIQQRDALNKSIAAARKRQDYSREKVIAKQLTKLEKVIAERQRLLAAGAPSQPKATRADRPADPALERAQQELDALNQKIRQTRLESEDRYMKVLERRISEYERRKREDDFLPKPRPERKLSKEGAKKLAEAEAAKVDFEEWRDARIMEQWPMAKKVWHGIKSGLGASVNVVSSYDLSAGRQLAGAIFSNAPKALYDWPGFYRVLARPFGRMFQGGWSEANAGELERQRLARPNAESGADKAAGIEYTALDSRKFTKHEENAHSVLDHWAKLPLFDKGKPVASGLTVPLRLGARGVRISNRAFATALNEVRAALFDELLRINYADRPPTKQELAVIGNAVNVATGRGKMSPMSVSVLSKILWSPKLLASRVQALTGQPLWTNPETIPETLRARKAVAKEYAKAAASMTLLFMVAGALSDSDNDDPRSSDFGKIVDDDTRIDPWGGLQQPVVLGARTLTGETTTLGGQTRSISADRRFGQRGIYHMWADFVRSKLRPDLGVGVNLVTGSDVMGNEATLMNQLPTMTMPLSLREAGPLIEAHGVPKGLGYETLNMLGIGVNVYDESGGFRPSR